MTLFAVALMLAGPAGALQCPEGQQPVLLVHSHNDYERQRPLAEALEADADSVEADIHLVGDALWVAHGKGDLKADRTLEGMYLAPLRQRAKANGGWVRTNQRTLGLLIDIKTDPAATYRALSKLLSAYRDLLTVHDHGTTREGAVTVIITGNRPRELIAAEPVRFAAIDGDSSDLDSEEPLDLVPWISIGWTGLMDRRGVGPFEHWLGRDTPQRQKGLIREIAERVHRHGRVLRFWGLPDDTAVWEAERETGVDILNTDHPADARRFADAAGCR